MSELPPRRVLVLNTGGTISMQSSDKGYVPGPPGFLTSMCRKLPMLHDTSFKMTTLDADAQVTPVSELGRRALFKIIDYTPLLDSSNMTHADWERIANDIASKYDDWDGFLVLHGTDTMSYTCSALSFMLQNLAKPVVVTGSQIPLSRPRSDGISNFQGALLMASECNVQEVCLFFADKLFRGNRCIKVDAAGLTAFDSPNFPPLAKLDISCTIRWDIVRQPSVGNFTVVPGFSDDIVVIRIYPGPFNTLKNTLQPPLRGAVLQTFGSGNAPTDPRLLEILQDAYDRGIVLVNVTQCVSGAVEAHYETGMALKQVGVVAGGDMTPEVALVKLGWLLGTGHTPEQVRSLMAVNMRGEMTSLATRRSMFHDGGATRSLCSAVKDFELSKAAECKSEDPSIEAAGNADSAKWRTSVISMLLCAAAAAGDLKAIQVMVSDGATAGAAGYDQRTPLHLAATAGQTAVVRFLLEQAGVEHSPVDHWGKSPLLDAVLGQHVDVIKLLVAAGAQCPNGPLGSLETAPNLTAAHFQRLIMERFPTIDAPDTTKTAGTGATRHTKRSRHQ